MAKKDISEMMRAAGFQNQFWMEFAAAVADLGGSADKLYAANNGQLREAAPAAARSIVEPSASAPNIDELVAQAKSSGYLNKVSPEVTEENFGSGRLPRPNYTTSSLRHLGLFGPRRYDELVATIDEKYSRPNMAEVLVYATTHASFGGWDGRTTVWFILDNGRCGCLYRTAMEDDTILHLDSAVIRNDEFGSELCVLIFQK